MPINSFADIPVKSNGDTITAEWFNDIRTAGINEPNSLTITTKTTTATLTDAEGGVILASSAGGAYTLTLPTAVGNDGLVYRIVKTTSDLNLITIDGNGAQTIKGATTFVLAFQYDMIEIVSDNANWQVIGSYFPFVGVNYNSNAGATPTNATQNYMDFEDVVYTSHSGLVSGAGSGIVTTTNTGWKIVSPIDAYWNINTAARFAGTFNAAGYVAMSVFVNGTEQKTQFIETDLGSSGGTPQGWVHSDVYVPATQRIEIGLYYVAGGNKGLSSDARQVFVTASMRRP